MWLFLGCRLVQRGHPGRPARAGGPPPAPRLSLGSDWLRGLSPAGQVVGGLAALGLGGALVALTAPQTPVHLASGVLGLGLAGLLWGLGGLLEQAWGLPRGLPAGLGLGLGVLAAITGVVAAFYDDETHRLCSEAHFGPFDGDSLAARQRALEAARPRLAHPLTRVSAMLDQDPRPTCALAEADLARQAQGLCPMHPIDGTPCLCDGARWPDATGCRAKPSCPTDNPDWEGGFNCWRD